MSDLEDILRLGRFRLDREGRALADANRIAQGAAYKAREAGVKAHFAQARIRAVRETGYRRLVGTRLQAGDTETIALDVELAREEARIAAGLAEKAREAAKAAAEERDAARSKFLSAQARVERLEAITREEHLKAIRKSEWREEADQ